MTCLWLTVAGPGKPIDGQALKACGYSGGSDEGEAETRSERTLDAQTVTFSGRQAQVQAALARRFLIWAAMYSASLPAPMMRAELKVRWKSRPMK